MPKIVALVPMRHNSERVKGKNYRDMAGKPLYHHIVTTLLECPEISTVVVDSDSPVIHEGLKEHFPTVKRLVRPDHLTDGHISMNEILKYITEKVEGDYYLQTHSTNPMLTSATLSLAINSFLERRNEFDSLFSVTRLQTRLYDKDGVPMNHNHRELLRTQDLPPVFEENSNMYIFNRKILVERNHRIGEKPHMFVMEDAKEALDIDEEVDFVYCDFLLRQKMQAAKSSWV